MIKAAGKTSLGTPLLFLGLSGENLTRLAAGEPILIKASDLAELALPHLTIAIHYGRTEQHILDDITKHGIRIREIEPT